MIRVLYWNVNNFTLNKINNTNSYDDVLMSGDRLTYMINQVFSQNIPDVFIVVEVWADNDGNDNGRLNNSTGATGALQLLYVLRNQFPQGAWALIPPICTGTDGYKESIAVYYRTTKLQFIGPYVWDGEQVIPAELMEDEPVVDYPTPWINPTHPADDALPSRQITYACETTGRNENTLGGQWWWPNPNYPESDDGLNFPHAWNRKPLLTEFVDTLGIHYRIYSVHTSPGTADQAVRRLYDIEEIQAATPDNTIDMIVGDFNVNSFTAFAGPNPALANPYWNLVSGPNPFVMAFPPYQAADLTKTADNALAPYRLTHLLECAEIDDLSVYATPFNTDGGVPADAQHNVYPRFGYMGSPPQYNNAQNTSGAIDNMFVRYGANLDRAIDFPTIVNTVVGTPYQNALNLTYVPSLAAPLPANGYSSININSLNWLRQFRSWPNFGVIRSTSDHVPLAIEI